MNLSDFKLGDLLTTNYNPTASSLDREIFLYYFNVSEYNKWAYAESKRIKIKAVGEPVVFLCNEDNTWCFLLIRKEIIALDWMTHNLRFKLVQRT